MCYGSLFGLINEVILDGSLADGKKCLSCITYLVGPNKCTVLFFFKILYFFENGGRPGFTYR